MIMGVDLIVLFKDSVAMWLLLLTSIAGAGFIIDRIIFYVMWRKDKPKSEEWFKKMLAKVAEGDKEQALSEGRKNGSALGRLIENALANTDLPEEDLTKVLNNTILKIQSKIEKNIGFLGTIASIAPLLGLFGTVVGIIRSFRDIAVSSSGGATVVAMGVAVALVTTAIGILIAVPALIAYNYFVSLSSNETMWLEGLRDELVITIKKTKGSRK